MSWFQVAVLLVHTAQYRILVAGVTVNVSWEGTSQAEVMGCPTHLGLSRTSRYGGEEPMQ